MVGGCYDGEWVYFGWDEGWGLICSTMFSDIYIHFVN